MNVLIIQRRMTEYRVPLFDALRRRLAEQGVTLQVVYGTPTSAEYGRDDSGTLLWAIKAPCVYLPMYTAKLVWQNIPHKLISDQNLIIIPHENMLLANYLLLFLRRYRGQAKLAFWGHGANFQSLTSNEVRDLFKAWTVRQVDWWFAYTAASVEKVVASGFDPQRITCLNNAVDVEDMCKLLTTITICERQALQQSLGLQGKNMAVFIGGLYKEKRLTFLCAAADKLRQRLPDFELLIIGDGSLNELIRRFVADRPWARWVGALHGRDKVLHLSLGRIILNPGLVGLNILDSFAFGLPLITTDCGIHSPEISYLRSGHNGIMTADDPLAYADAVERLLTDEPFREMLASNCRADAKRYTLENMVKNFTSGILSALSLQPSSTSSQYSTLPLHIVIIWQRLLPYHRARIRQTQQRLAALGHRLTAIEVASQDASYGFDQYAGQENFTHICCLPGSSYHDHTANEIHSTVLQSLRALQPDVIFAPATPFPEGIAAVAYRLGAGCRSIMMDDAWEHTDQRGWLTSAIKRLIHRNIDGVFIPAPSHRTYYEKLGFPRVRTLFGVDVVDNDYFCCHAAAAWTAAAAIRHEYRLPEKYFLFVGRFLPRKGLETLLKAYCDYCAGTGSSAWKLVLVGGGPHLEQIRAQAADTVGIHFAGVIKGEELCHYYGLAQALVVPSVFDPWGLVVNEGMAAGLPVLVSRGCGAAATLVVEGENGWTFAHEDTGHLTALMLRMSKLPTVELQRMGDFSRGIIADWSLDRFADGVIEALNLTRREPGGLLADMAVRLWKGRVSLN